MAGRPQKPNAIKEAQGNPGRRPLKEEAQLDAAKPWCPGHLSKEAKREWERVVHDLHEAGLLVKADKAVLAMYCQAWADWVEAREKVLKEGATFTTKNGYSQKSAWVTIRDKAFDQVMKCLQELGMTPAARARVAARPMDRKDPFEELIEESNSSQLNNKDSDDISDPAVSAFLAAAQKKKGDS